MPETLLEKAIDRPFTFKQRPTPLACDLRPEWRLYVLVLLVDQCRSSKASLQQLHVLDWAIRTHETQEAFLEFLNGERAPNQTIVRYDPSLNRAVDFGFGEELLTHREQESSTLIPLDTQQSDRPYRISLAPKGVQLANLLKENADLLSAEKEFLARIGKKLTQKQVEVLFDWGVVK